MRKRFKVFGLSVVALIAGAASSTQSFAAISPLGVAIVPPVQFPPSDFTVAGARASVLWGKHRTVYGFDVGVIGNMTELGFGGIGVSGIFNYNRGTANVIGLQAAGLANVNVNKARIFGVQVTAGINSNQAESTLVGLQIAPISNYSPFTQVWGAQLGIYNKAREVYGFQIGVVNVAENLHGIQIGLLNFHKRGLFEVAPIINIGF